MSEAGHFIDADARRLALEVIATLVNIKRTAAERVLTPAGVPAELVKRFLNERDPTTGEKRSKREAGTVILEALGALEREGQVVRRIIEIAADWQDFHLAQDEYRARSVVQKARECTLWGCRLIGLSLTFDVRGGLVMTHDLITSHTSVITPEDARQLATQFFATSKVSPTLVRAYADDMRSGRWLLNGASIVLSSDQKVLDGRARILACIEAGRPFEALVVEGIEPSAFETMDALRKRTLADVLTIRQIQHGRALAAALRIIWGYRTRTLPTPRQPSSMTLLGLIEDHPEIRDSILPSLRTAPLLPHGTGLALHYLFGLANPAKCDAFFTELSNETLSDAHGPIAQLRRLLTELRGKGGNRKQAYVLAVCIKAWNAFSAGKPLKLLRYAPEREPFPRISGLREPETPLFDRHLDAEGDSAAAIGKAGLTAQVEEITPEIAERLLQANSLNRRISGPVVERYARDMKAGRWKLNGQTIKISARGRLLDGHPPPPDWRSPHRASTGEP
ncbi:hypothetical protein [Phenylobacterium sp.]|uniref:hypothetical protein n=1 Tax=Phenylobacterium sp. TaxID=1871053 RepID=UPI0025EAAFBE|nr:hypothetical protein [Phenylobacterium sp.]MBX3482399.1 hypothetical protein [Phenylobacterium sp.]MCW5758192.1 hypothetical protein [Phenylobacterium sp.]